MKRSLLARIALVLLLGVLASLLAASGPTASNRGTAEAPSKKAIERLIEDLSSDRFEVRERATRALTELEIEPPALRQALNLSDLEVRQRLTLILEAHVRKRARRGITRAKALASEGRVDEMVERLVIWKGWDQGNEASKIVAELAARLIEWEDRAFGKMRFLAKGYPVEPIIGPLDEPPTPKIFADKWTRSPLLRGNEIALSDRYPDWFCRVLVASESIRAPVMIGCVIVAGGDIHLRCGANSVIICDGDVETATWINRCLVIARGKITCHGDIVESAILSANTVELPKGAKIIHTAILSNETPKVVKFFDPAVAGIAVEKANRRLQYAYKGVWIKEIRKGSPFAEKLQVGDNVTSIGGMNTPSEESFRRALRRKLAEGGPSITFTVQRAKETRDVVIPIKD